MHDNLEFPSAQSMADTLDLFAGLGLTQHVTEMDVSIYSGSDTTRSRTTTRSRPSASSVRRTLPRLLPVFQALQGQLTSVTFWGLADDNTWLTSPAASTGRCSSTRR